MARKKRDKAPADDVVPETQESPALDAEAGGEIFFAREDVESVGDPAAASVESEPVPDPDSGPSWTKLGSGAAAEEPAAEEVPVAEPVVDALPVDEPPVDAVPVDEPAAYEPLVDQPVVDEPPLVESPMGESPAEADRRAAEQAAADGSPVGAVVGAFVGAFVAAKVIGRFGGGDD
jgi:hypothetical protein